MACGLDFFSSHSSRVSWKRFQLQEKLGNRRKEVSLEAGQKGRECLLGPSLQWQRFEEKLVLCLVNLTLVLDPSQNFSFSQESQPYSPERAEREPRAEGGR